jgi:asparagine synthase (glutamine-hydrolysing)
MCGIAGILSLDGRPVVHEEVRAMTDALAHRGPDEGAVRLLGEGVSLGRAQLGFGHRRLKVIDLSAAAAQPMRDPHDRACLAYNGELYNTAELRRELESQGVRFRSRSDTEVVLMALLSWGTAALDRFNGMFALAFWEQASRRLLLARDRFGEKPLYYCLSGGRLSFASEIQALAGDAASPLDLDQEAIELYLTFGWIPAPWSIYRSIRKLPHASFLEATPGGTIGQVTRYYRLEERLRRRPEGDHAGAVREALAGAVRRRLASDVPLGAFLSGGVDSSAVVTFMARDLPEPPRTYSVSIPGDRYFDEGPMARRLADEVGARHVEVPVDAARLLDEVPTALGAFGEPFADSSAIPCSILAREARRGLTVALSGDGGDEVFAGYRIFRALTAARRARHLAGPGRTIVRALLSPWPARHGGGIAGAVQRARKMIDGLHPDLAVTHADWLAILTHGARTALRPGVPDAGLGRALLLERHRRFGGGLDAAMAAELDLSLPDDMLAKVDRTSMRHALEVRAPFLDPEVVELALGLPAGAHVTLFEGKRLLRRSLRGVVPDRVLDAPKRGFEVPVGDWLAAPLADAFRDLVTPQRLEEVAGLDGRLVSDWYRDHRRRRADRGKALWALFVLCHWHRHQRPRRSVRAARTTLVGLPRAGALS